MWATSGVLADVGRCKLVDGSRILGDDEDFVFADIEYNYTNG